MRPIITLTTDFGLHDPFVGIMKGVILNIIPDVELVDITHQIDPQNVLQAALVLQTAHSYFPDETVHLVVVDPGVGSNRRSIAARIGAYTFIAPDNGVLTPILKADACRTFELTEQKYFLETISSTFHGRDIFAPAAAWAAKGTELSEMGRPIDDPVTLDLPDPVFQNGILTGQIVYIDRFGNLMSNISGEMLNRHIKNTDKLVIKIGHKQIRGMSSSYSQRHAGEIGSLLNSWNNLEIFCREGDASALLKCGIGQKIIVTDIG
ncbi:MAG: S-adenosyl-l-methionine hydroxide adenosyltransferase family protein [Nitrospinales bacterium]